ncbi:MAG: thiamine pyrophosphate-binding protein [Ruminococcus flavefaciens]|nr:thiamine pyrophosphate-binding protein [Ruminococcus flavefaciens]
MFFLPGGGCMHLTDSLGRSKDIQGISLLHEQAVAIATEIYASVSEKTGAALVTTGPGGTNAVTGVLSAYQDSVPCIFISGQVKTTDLKSRFNLRGMGTQEAGIVEIVSSITKYAVMVTDKEQIRYHLERAWYEATTGRKGPVWVDIPLDIQGAQIDPNTLAGFNALPETYECTEAQVDQAIKLINQAKRPIIMSGNGVMYCQKEFHALADFLQIPVIPSWKFADLVPNDHPLYVGRCGTLGERAANFAMQNADLIISLGCRLDYSMTGYERKKWAPLAKKIIVEIEKNEIDKLEIPVDLPVVGDVKDFMQKMLKRKDEFEKRDISAWYMRIKEWKKRYPVVSEKFYDDANGMSMYAAVAEVAKRLKNDAVIVPASAGTVAEIVFQSIQLKQGQKLRTNNGLGSMGYELPGAIGAYMAASREVITFAADGGIQLNIQELATIAGRKLPIKIFLICNNGYASIQNMQRNHFNGYYVASTEESGLFIPDMEKVSKAYGLPVYRAGKISELRDAIENTLAEAGPAMCIMDVSPTSLVEPRSATQVMPDGTIKSSTLENQYPFLSDDEVAENMKN